MDKMRGDHTGNEVVATAKALEISVQELLGDRYGCHPHSIGIDEEFLRVIAGIFLCFYIWLSGRAYSELMG